jgi:hypothetical protein
MLEGHNDQGPLRTQIRAWRIVGTTTPRRIDRQPCRALSAAQSIGAPGFRGSKPRSRIRGLGLGLPQDRPREVCEDDDAEGDEDEA